MIGGFPSLKSAGFWDWALLEVCWVWDWALLEFDEFWIEDLGWGFTMAGLKDLGLHQ